MRQGICCWTKVSKEQACPSPILPQLPHAHYRHMLGCLCRVQLHINSSLKLQACHFNRLASGHVPNVVGLHPRTCTLCMHAAVLRNESLQSSSVCAPYQHLQCSLQCCLYHGCSHARTHACDHACLSKCACKTRLQVIPTTWHLWHCNCNTVFTACTLPEQPA